MASNRLNHLEENTVYLKDRSMDAILPEKKTITKKNMKRIKKNYIIYVILLSRPVGELCEL